MKINVAKHLSNANFMNFSGYELMNSFKKKNWEEPLVYLEDQEVQYPKEVINHVKSNMFAIEVDLNLCDDICDCYVNDHIDSAGTVKKLLTLLPKHILKKSQSDKFKWFKFCPVDYNRNGDDNIIIVLSKEKALLNFVEGDY